MKIIKVAMGKVHDELQAYLADQPEEAINDIVQQVMVDIEAYYRGEGSSFSKRYSLTSPHNEYIQNYTLEVLAVRSNNATGFGDANMNRIELKMYNRDLMDESQHKNHISKIKRMLEETLWHEMGHYYIEKKRGMTERLYFQQGFEKYFDDAEELVLHSRDTWKKIIAKYPHVHTLPVDKIKRIVARHIADLPASIGFYGARFPKTLQSKYVNFIWKHYVKPNLPKG
jgi:predicted Zn-dependent protease with MMP-like domain